MERKNYVEYLLKNYHQIKREIEVLKDLLEISFYESEEETIEGMNFQTFKGEKVKHSKIGDKTANIAMGYKEKNQAQETERVRELKREIRKKEVELLKLETSVEVLEEKLQRVIKGIYFERKTRAQMCREMYISEGTLGRWRKKGVEGIGKYMR